MEAEEQQDATVRAGGQTGGWELRGDGSFDAAGNWWHFQNALTQNARVRNETAEEAEPFLTGQVAWDILDAQQEDGCMAAERAAQILEDRFLQWDRNEQDGRRQVFMEQVQERYTEVAEEWCRLMDDEQEQAGGERWRVPGTVMYIGNLAGGMTEEMLESTFEQIGLVLGAGLARAGCGWVEFQEAEDALGAVERFDGVECAEQAMLCGDSESVWEAQAEDY